ncbi:MAG: pmbA [Haloplasmataceae bacterium]|nr:pmbA [Haloplasmataceae bacterium]
MNFKLLIEKAKLAGINEIEIYSEHNEGLKITLFEAKVDKYVLSNTVGLAVRGIYCGKMGYVSVENVSDDSIDFIINKLIENASTITSSEKSFIYAGSENYPKLNNNFDDFSLVDPQKKINLLLQLESKIYSLDSRITKVASCSYSETKVKTTIVNSKGLNLSKVDGYAFLSASAVAKENGDVKSDGDYTISKMCDFNVDELASKIVKRTVSLLNATPVESKSYPVIFENEVFVDLLSAFESMFSGEAALKNLTMLKDKVGQKIVNDKVTLIDDPLTSLSFFNNAFDDEGVACLTKEVISNGVLNTLLHNLKTANAFNVKSTGNGFKASLNAPISVSSNNLYLKPGTTSLNELIASTNEGLFITSLQGLHAGVDPVSGNFSLQSSGFLIENGKISRPVTLIVVSGNFLKMLNEVEEIGKDLIFTPSQLGSPSVKITSLAVSGK